VVVVDGGAVVVVVGAGGDVVVGDGDGCVVVVDDGTVVVGGAVVPVGATPAPDGPTAPAAPVLAAGAEVLAGVAGAAPRRALDEAEVAVPPPGCATDDALDELPSALAVCVDAVAQVLATPGAGCPADVPWSCRA
jgi:hypothetical protein